MRVFVGRLVSFRRGVVGAAVVLGLAVSAAAQPAPDFDAVPWTGIGCPAADLVRHTTPAGVDLAGDATFPAIYIAHDADYAYFRYRVDGDPGGPGGFAQYSWTALMQVPSGDPFLPVPALAERQGRHDRDLGEHRGEPDRLLAPLPGSLGSARLRDARGR